MSITATNSLFEIPNEAQEGPKLLPLANSQQIYQTLERIECVRKHLTDNDWDLFLNFQLAENDAKVLYENQESSHFVYNFQRFLNDPKNRKYVDQILERGSKMGTETGYALVKIGKETVACALGFGVFGAAGATVIAGVSGPGAVAAPAALVIGGATGAVCGAVIGAVMGSLEISWKKVHADSDAISKKVTYHYFETFDFTDEFEKWKRAEISKFAIQLFLDKMCKEDTVLKCPVSGHVFFDPVLASDGNTYEFDYYQHDLKDGFVRKLVAEIYKPQTLKEDCWRKHFVKRSFALNHYKRSEVLSCLRTYRVQMIAALTLCLSDPQLEPDQRQTIQKFSDHVMATYDLLYNRHQKLHCSLDQRAEELKSQNKVSEQQYDDLMNTIDQAFKITR